MDRFIIITNDRKDTDCLISRKIFDKITGTGRSVNWLRFDDGWKLVNIDGGPAVIEADAECALVIGGDGTMLRAERELVDHAIPMVGINMGTLGYLADVNSNDWEKAVEELMYTAPRLEERMLVSGTIYRGGEAIFSQIALDDIVVGCVGYLHMIGIKVSVDGQELKSYHADGIIVSTPTGSTAYNLSAGGPIVLPEASMMVLTPLSPHVLINRSVVVPDTAAVSLELTSKKPVGTEGIAAVYFDGLEFPMQVGDRVEVVRAKQTCRLYRMNDYSFLENLSMKMSEGESKA